ncbi:MAG: 4a-hydroxytetrahydrobiopterin dehydratase [Candidatus Latescibacterota bacterium]|nr:4a-hydroxytetrahydrobiopterin dehydratase [Candidatus Latescibacterota bacterium]
MELTSKVCQPCEGGVDPMTPEEIGAKLDQVEEWEYTDGYLARSFSFNNYYQTISFVNAVAWVANRERHHPVLEVQFRSCTVKYWTHAINGISENDFICAAKINQLAP